MAVTLALAGDTMLGRKVGERIARTGPRSLFSPAIRDLFADADLVLANLECCISARGTRWPAPGKPFFFRAPPEAVETLAWLGVTDVTLANNHALDYGIDALSDTRRLLREAGIRTVGAGSTPAEAHEPIRVGIAGLRLGILGITDHPGDFAVGRGRPGVAYAPLDETGAHLPPWLVQSVRTLKAQVDVVVVTPHWGPNMTQAPLKRVRETAKALLDLGTTVVAGHSAHVFHGVWRNVLFDLGDFIDDYMVDRNLRNDLGLLWFVTVDRFGPIRLRAVPIALDYCFTRLADRMEYAWVRERFARACAQFAVDVVDQGDALAIYWD